MNNRRPTDNLNKTKLEITEQLFRSLDDRGVHPRQEVRTAAGVADLVSDTAVYAIVPTLTADNLRTAAQNVLAWRDAINQKLKAVVFGGRSDADPKDAIDEARAQGVVVNFWQDGDKLGWQ